MKRNVITLSLLLCIVLTACAKQPSEINILLETGNAFKKVAEQALPAVVFIDVETTIEVPQYGYRYQPFEDFWGRRGQMMIPQELEPKKYSQEGQGSGFIISKDGYILTNNHVIKGADRITVTLADDRKFSATVIGSDPKTEVALIKIEDPHDLPYLELGNSEKLAVGEWVLAAGNPFGLTQTITAGIVSAKGRDDVGITEYANFIQTDAAINPGNSGGPLLDIDGKVVGINTAIYTRSGGYMGIGFAIPINQAVQIKDQLIEHGTISRSVLGILIQDVNEELAEHFELEEHGGILISQVFENSAAMEAGLHAGDILIEMDGKPVGKAGAFRSLLAATPPGTIVTLKIFRNGKYELVEATTKPLDGTDTIANSRLMEKIGLTIDSLDSELGRQLKLTDERGVLVAEVEQNSPAWRAGLKPGQIIRSINRQPVQTVKDFMQILTENLGGNLLLLVSDERGSRFVVMPLE